MQNILISDQYAPSSVASKNERANSTAPVMETALQHVSMGELAASTSSDLGVTLIEVPVTGLLVLRARDSNALQAAVSSATQLALPGKLGSSTNGSVCIRWFAPDEWLLSCPIDEAFDIEKAIRASAGAASIAASIAITNVSGGYSMLILRGANAEDVLRKSTPYDVHPANFSAGKVVNTVFAKAQVCLRCVSANEYELVVRRSFADYVWHWLQVASAEYGLSVELE